MPENSSKVAPGEVGNTKSPPVAKKQESCKKHWIITLKANNVPNSSIYSWVRGACEKAIWQCEEGSGENKFTHYQITMTLKTKQRFTWLKNHFNKIAHCEVVNNIDAAFDYTQKEDTRILGPFYYPEPIQEIIDPLDGVDYYPWQKQIIEIIKLKPDPRKVYWYWEPSGAAGKTSFCKHLIIKYNCTYIRNGKKQDIFYAIDNNTKVLLIDISRSCDNIDHLYDIIECVKDGMIFSGKYESKTKVFNTPHVIIFANEPPNTNKLSLDRWCITKI